MVGVVPIFGNISSVDYSKVALQHNVLGKFESYVQYYTVMYSN